MDLKILNYIKGLIFFSQNTEVKKQNKRLESDLEKLKQMDKEQIIMKIKNKMKKLPFLLITFLMTTMWLSAQNEFITTWQTTTNNEEITIPTNPNYEYDYTIYWGDGSISMGEDGNATHTYATAGTYTVSITGTFPAIYFNNSGDKNKILSIEQWGNITWKSMTSAFNGCSNLNITNPNIDTPDLSVVIEAWDMFRNTNSFTGDSLGNWDVSNIKNMDAMFSAATSFNGDISGWDVRNVTTMRLMFRYAINFNQNIGNWDVSNVTDMTSMFEVAASFDQNLENWDLSKITFMSNMFQIATLSKENYDATLIGWATDTSGSPSDGIDDVPSNITFSGGNSNFCISEDLRNELIGTYNWNITDGGSSCFTTTWKTNNPGESNDNQITIPTFVGETYDYNVNWGDGSFDTNVNGEIKHTYANAGTYTIKITGLFPRIYFHGGDNDRKKILTIEQWGNNPWTSMVFAFSFCENLNITNPSIDSPNLSNVTNLTGMFNYCFNFNGNVSNWDVSTVNSMQVMFRESRKFNQDLSLWDVSNVNNMISMFEGADAFDQSLGNWDISSLTNATDMFNTITLSSYNYDAIIQGWAEDSSGVSDDNIDDIPTNLTFSAGNSLYCNSGFLKNKLESTYSWNITDGGVNTICENAFITTWKTDNEGVSDNNTIIIPTNSALTYQYLVDWGDGSRDLFQTGNAEHTYANPGTYTVSIIGTFPQILFPDFGDNKKILTIEQWGNNPWVSFEFAFQYCTNLNITNEGIDEPNLSNVSSLFGMFLLCTNFNGNITNWDVSNISSMTIMFAGCETFNQNIKDWDVGNVNDMNGMFESASSFNQELSTWDLSNVNEMYSIFDLSGLSTENYDTTLIGWAKDSSPNSSDGIDDIPYNIFFGAVGTSYCTAATERNLLVNTFGWNITDNGLECTTTWNGNNGTSWSDSSNWSYLVPNSSWTVIIPEVTNAPIISASTNAQVKDLTITETEGIIIESGGSLIVSGTATGNVTYNRTLNYAAGNTNGWYLVSSPVSGVSFDDAFVTNNDIAVGTGNNRAVAVYTTLLDSWIYLPTGTSINSTSGIGYSMKRGTATGNIAFTGNINTEDVTSAISVAGHGYNLLGNPYTSYINSATFLTDNTSNLESETIWLWNQSTENYETKLSGIDADFKLAPTQGFFVKATSENSVNFAEVNQSGNTDTFQKSNSKHTNSQRPEIHLKLTDGTKERFAKIYYIAGTTTGFDNGYDGEAFNGQANALDIFTHLVTDSQGKNFQVQSLPNSNYENMVVPVGIKSEAGTITFSADALNLPAGYHIYLEDKEAGSFIQLDESNTKHEVNLDASINSIGRFYMHLTNANVLSSTSANLNNIIAYLTTNENLRITGIQSGKTRIQLYDINGKEFVDTSLLSSANGIDDIPLPKLSNGVYLLKINAEQRILTKKIIIK